jgi:hypothetical protein
MELYTVVVVVALVVAVVAALAYRRVQHPERTATHDSTSDPGHREQRPG